MLYDADERLVAVTDQDDALAGAEVALDACQVVVRRLDAPRHAAGDVRGRDEEVVLARERQDLGEQLVRGAPVAGCDQLGGPDLRVE